MNGEVSSVALPPKWLSLLILGLHYMRQPLVLIRLMSLVLTSISTPIACSGSRSNVLRTDDIGVVHITLPGAIPAPLSAAGLDPVLLHVFLYRKQRPNSRHTDIAGYLFAESGVCCICLYTCLSARSLDHIQRPCETLWAVTATNMTLCNTSNAC